MSSSDESHIFHPTDLQSYSTTDLIEERPTKLSNPSQRSSGDPPDLMEEDPVFFSEDGEINEKEHVSVQIVPNKNTKDPNSLATNANVGKVANLAGGVDATDSTYIHAPYAKQIAKAKVTGVDSSNYDSVKTSIGHPSFNDFANEAYASERGYAIRVNPVTGQKEMFIAGTRTAQDWASNAMEIRPKGGKWYAKHMFKDLADSEQFDDLDHHATKWREEAQQHYEEVAIEEGVEVIYGHSRGGAIVADMNLPDDVQKVGLDAAMVIADNKGMVNYYEAGEGSGKGWSWAKSRFDAGIGLSGKKNKHMSLSKKFHHSWGD